MAFYLVRFSVGDNNEVVYPESVAEIIWKSTVYHSSKEVMIGETDTDVKPDGKKVVSLTNAEAKEMIREYLASYPKPD